MGAPPSTRRRTLVLAASLAASKCGVLPVLWGRGDPVSDRCVGDIGVAVGIALGRAHQGGVSNLAGQWRDSGSPVPGYDGRIDFPFDPHVTGGCAITLDEAAATALSDALGEWWG